MAWFQLKAGGNPTIPNDYNAASTPSCSGTGKICAIQTTASGSGQPQLTDALKNEMIVALEGRTSSSNVLLKP